MQGDMIRRLSGADPGVTKGLDANEADVGGELSWPTRQKKSTDNDDNGSDIR